jgi:hypothetical protein
MVHSYLKVGLLAVPGHLFIDETAFMVLFYFSKLDFKFVVISKCLSVQIN